MPAGSRSEPAAFVQIDSVEAAGSYSPTQIAIRHAELPMAPPAFRLRGTLDAAPGTSPEYDGDSVLHARVDAANVDIADVQPFLAASGGPACPPPAHSTREFQADGPLHAPAGSGSVAMDRGSIYGESVTRLRVEGAMANHVLKLSSAALIEAGGTVSASGSYDFKTGTFDVDAHGSAIDLSRIGWGVRRNLEAAGKLQVSVTGSGSLDDPRLTAHATVDSLTLGGQRFGALEVSANTASHTLAYNATTQLQGAELRLQGQTALQRPPRNAGPARFLPLQHWRAAPHGAH